MVMSCWKGFPGLAKTLTIKSLSQAIHARFEPHPTSPRICCQRMGVGTMIFNQ